MAKSPHTGGERGIVPDGRAIGITRRLEVHDPLLWYAAIAAARWRVWRSGSAPGGPWRMTWLPGIPRIWSHQSCGRATRKLSASLSASVRPTRTCHPPGSVYVIMRTLGSCGDDGGYAMEVSPSEDRVGVV